MATIYDYRYYIDGRSLVILQRSIESIYDPYLSLKEDLFVSPSVADSSAVAIRFTVPPSDPTDENSTLDIGENLALAIVEYVKSKVAEDNGNDDRAQNYMNKFYSKVAQYANSRKGAPRIIMPAYTGVIK
jgi:hypothetical protein